MARRKKADAQRSHARLRAKTRYGIILSPQDNKELAKRIKNNDRVKFLERQSSRVTVWLVEYDGQDVPVVYDKQRKTIVTVLPSEYLKEI